MGTNLFQCPFLYHDCYFLQGAFFEEGLAAVSALSDMGHICLLFPIHFSLGPWRWSKASFSKSQIGLTKKITPFLAPLVCGNDPKPKELLFWKRKNPAILNTALLPPSSYLGSFASFFPMWTKDAAVLLYHFFPSLSPMRNLCSLSVNRAPSSGNRRGRAGNALYHLTLILKDLSLPSADMRVRHRIAEIFLLWYLKLTRGESMTYYQGIPLAAGMKDRPFLQSYIWNTCPPEAYWALQVLSRASWNRKGPQRRSQHQDTEDEVNIEHL